MNAFFSFRAIVEEQVCSIKTLDPDLISQEKIRQGAIHYRCTGLGSGHLTDWSDEEDQFAKDHKGFDGIEARLDVVISFEKSLVASVASPDFLSDLGFVAISETSRAVLRAPVEFQSALMNVFVPRQTVEFEIEAKGEMHLEAPAGLPKRWVVQDFNIKTSGAAA